MPYVLLRKNGKPCGLHNILMLEDDLSNLRYNSSKKTTYTLINTTTRRIVKIKGIK